MNSALGYGFNVLAFVVGACVYFAEARRRRMHLPRMTEVALFGAVLGVVAAAFGQWIYNSLSSHALDASGGRTIVGGVLGGWLGVEIAKRRIGIREATGPLWALALPAGESVGRLGCWFHGCCYGRVCTLPWAVEQHGAMRHPTQFYLSLAAFASLGILWWLKDRVDVFALSLLLWSLSRIVIEPLRESSVQTPWVVLSICFLVAVYAIVRLVRSCRTQLSPL